MFKKILIANRGEIALRVIRTCKEMGIKTVAVYSTADAESLHVKFADEAVCIGPAPSNLSYLKMSNIIAAAEITNADAIHPGYGFLSENSKFSKICQEHGIKFIGAAPEMIDRMGDKASAKSTMIEAGVPCVPGSVGILESYEQAAELANQFGYPVMLKATAGGGGKGMRAVWKEEDLLKAWEGARQESAAAFGNDGMYLEKLIEEPRHIEIQIVGDSYGKACHLSERDCSVQRRHQKLTEETPSPFMTDELRLKMGEAAVKAAEYIKSHAIAWSVIYAEHDEIDEKNIRKATIDCMHKAVNDIMEKMNQTPDKLYLLVDGNDFIPMMKLCDDSYIQIPHKCIESGDNTYASIAAASILAKVTRDEYIIEMCKEHPYLHTHYDLENNKGYGTKKHMDGIKSHGISQWHRKSFGLCKEFS